MIIDPATLSVTHLVIDPKHGEEHGRLVPLDLVDTATGEIGLRCTLAEFGQLEPAEETELLERSGGTGVGGAAAPMGISHAPRADVQDVVPRGKQRLAAVTTSMLWMVRSERWRASWSMRAITG